MPETILKIITDTYALFERLNLSIAGILAIAVGLAIALMFAFREAASWFFKIDDIKNDIRDLRELNTLLEGEIRALQTLVAKLIEHERTLPAPEKTEPSFPIVH